MKKSILVLSISILVLVSKDCFSQKEHNVWYFGYNAGISFNSGNPVSIPGGKTYTAEGVASICDSSGNLLFYSDGITVWDVSHTAMPNGSGLLGGISSTQSAAILKKPGSTNLFYLFTAPQEY